jgi:hypothetical protein
MQPRSMSGEPAMLHGTTSAQRSGGGFDNTVARPLERLVRLLGPLSSL